MRDEFGFTQLTLMGKDTQNPLVYQWGDVSNLLLQKPLHST